MNYRVSTIAWGDWHLNIFLNWNLRSLNSTENRIFFLNNNVKYTIYTAESDVKKIKKNFFFNKLSKICNFEIEVMNEIFKFNPIAIHHKYWLLSKKKADSKNEIIIFNPPDVVWSANSFLSIEKLIKSGKKAIFMSYSRSIAESLLNDLNKVSKNYKFLANDLVKLSIKNMHPLTMSYNFESQIIPDHSEQIFSFNENGYTVTSLVRELFVVSPNLIQLSNLSLPVNNIKKNLLHKSTNSNEIFAISFAPLLQFFDWYLGSKRNKILDISNWWLTYNSPINDYMLSNTAFFNYNNSRNSLPIKLVKFLEKISIGKEFLKIFYKLPFFPNFFIKTTLIDLIQNFFENKILKEKNIFFFVSDARLERLLGLISKACNENLSKDSIKQVEKYLEKISYKSLKDLLKKNSINSDYSSEPFNIYKVKLGSKKEISFFYNNEILKLHNCEKYIYNLCIMKIPNISYTREKIDENFSYLERLFYNYQNCYCSIVNKKENEKNLTKIKKYYENNTHIIFNRVKDKIHFLREVHRDEKTLTYFYKDKFFYTQIELFFSRNFIIINEKYYKINPMIRDLITFLVEKKNILILKHFTSKSDVFFGSRAEKEAGFIKKSLFYFFNLLFKKNYISKLQSSSSYTSLIESKK